MVNALRINPVLRREIPFHRAGIRRREYFRQRLFRNRRTVPYHLYIDRDEVPSEIIRAVNNRENIPHDLSFAPLPPELNPDNNRQLQAIPAGEEPEEQESSDSCSVSSTASTIVLDLDDRTAGIPQGLLRAWETNAGIRRDRQVQTAPHRPDNPASFSSYSTPDYSPVRPGEFEFNPIEISPIDESLADQEVNNILDYLNSEEFLGTIDDVYRT